MHTRFNFCLCQYYFFLSHFLSRIRKKLKGPLGTVGKFQQLEINLKLNFLSSSLNYNMTVLVSVQFVCVLYFYNKLPCSLCIYLSYMSICTIAVLYNVPPFWSHCTDLTCICIAFIQYSYSVFCTSMRS